MCGYMIAQKTHESGKKLQFQPFLTDFEQLDTFQTPGDGNCLVRSLSSASFGTEEFHRELRVRLACELAFGRNNYLSPDCVVRGTVEDGNHLLSVMHMSGDFHLVPSLELAYDCEVMASVSDGKDLGMWHLLAAANILGGNILWVYPAE